MESKELRIGNYVKVWDEIYQVNQVLPDSIIHNYIFNDPSSGSEEIDNENVYPIPITEALLFDLGFTLAEEKEFIKRYVTRDSYGMDDFVLCYSKQENKYFFDFSSIKYFINFAVFEYMHHLQNVYFALINKELQFKKTSI